MPKRADNNQRGIVRGLRAFGASVWCTHTVGHGPDLIVGFRGKSYLMEVKGEYGLLTAAEQRWRDNWKGDYYVVRSLQDAIDVLMEDEE